MAKNGNVNFSDLNNFRKKIEENLNADQVDLFIQSCAKELAARLLAKVIKRTPVGEKPELKGEKYVVAEGKSGKKRKFLSAEAARIEQYWSGYSGGTLRRGWTSKTHEEAANSSGKGKDARGYANSLNVNHKGDVYIIEVINPVKYAPYVEYGHRQQPGKYIPALGKRLKGSWVEGKFMLTISSQEIERDAPRVLENKLKKKLEECFK